MIIYTSFCHNYVIPYTYIFDVTENPISLYSWLLLTQRVAGQLTRSVVTAGANGKEGIVGVDSKIGLKIAEALV